jgi:hypothetical protein
MTRIPDDNQTDNVVSLTSTGALSEVTAEDLQKLRKLLIDVASHIVKGEQKQALADLKEIEAIVMREQRSPSTAPVAPDREP